MSLVATIFAATVLLWVGSFLAQLLFHIAMERMLAKYPLATNSNLGRELSMPESTRIIQDGSHLLEAIEVVESEVLG